MEKKRNQVFLFFLVAFVRLVFVSIFFNFTARKKVFNIVSLPFFLLRGRGRGLGVVEIVRVRRVVGR